MVQVLVMVFTILQSMESYAMPTLADFVVDISLNKKLWLTSEQFAKQLLPPPSVVPVH